MTSAFLLALFLGLFSALCAAKSTGLTSQVDLCHSAQPVESVADLSACDFKEFSASPINLFESKPFWLRVRVALDAAAEQQDVAIEVAPHFIPQVTFYAKTNGAWVTRKTGSAISSANPFALAGGYLFVVNPSATGHTDYYLQLRAHSPISINVMPWPAKALHLQTGVGIYLGAIAFVLLFACVSYALTRNALMGRFCLFMLVLTVSIYSGSGLLAQDWLTNTPEWDDPLFGTLLSIRLAFWVWLLQGFLLNYQPPRWYRLSGWLMYALAFLCAVTASTSFTPMVPAILIITVLMSTLLQTIATAKSPKVERPIRNVLVIGFGLLSLFICLLIVIGLNPPTMPHIAIYMVRLVDFVPALILLSMIMLQHRLLHHELMATRESLLAMQVKKDYEQKLLDERRTLIDMLTHELKNPLASISLAVGSLRHYFKREDTAEKRRLDNIRESISNMDSVIERCSLMNSLDENTFRLSPSWIEADAFLAELCERHEAAERIQRETSQPIRLHTDRKLLQMVLNNLLDNAAKYSINHSDIVVRTRTVLEGSQSYAVFEVSNTINPAWSPDPEILFKRYYRHEQAQSLSGSGLGLFLVQEICSKLGGTAHFEQQDNTVYFRVTLSL